MTTSTPAFIQRKHVWLAIGVSLALLWLSILIHVPHVRALLVQGDNDDIMRWMLIKDWLGGQSWFDMTQYRVEPPEGLSLHWSRYLDALIGGLYSLLTLFLPPEAAERWTLVLWPNILLIILLIVMAQSTTRILGPVAALFAILLVMTWMPIRGITFANGRIDHHNFQILLTSMTAMAMILPGRPRIMGAIAGLAAAFSLAIGLETLVFVASAGIVLLLRATFGGAEPTQRLVGFCIALLAGALLFYAGQTPLAEWMTPHCDQLSTPFLAIVLIAVVSCLAPLALGPRFRNPFLRLGAVLCLSAIGVVGFSPLLKPCLAGPYGMLQPEAQEFITSRISEALPALVFAVTRPLTFVNIMLPLFLVTTISTVLWAIHRRTYDRSQQAAIGQMLVFAWLGLLGSLIQVRLNIIAAPALPFLAGHIGAHFLRRQADGRNLRGIVVMVVLGFAVFAVQQLNAPALKVTSWLSGRDVAQGIEKQPIGLACRNEATLAQLNALPQSAMLTTLSLGAPLILVTHHHALSVPYQRGKYTFWNGSFPFRSEELMLRAIDQSKPDYVLICRKDSYDAEHGFAQALNDGYLPPWLAPLPFPSDQFLVLQVQYDALPPEI